jgi:hypothetical protein
VREAAYDSLLLSRRREWHESCARVLEERFVELAANEPELLAHHFGEAGLAGPACDVVIYNLGLAAGVLLAANRPGDGIALLDRVLAAVEESGVGFCLSEFYRVRGECLLAIDRKNKDEARQAFAVARDIAHQQGASSSPAAPKRRWFRCQVSNSTDTV